jgi:hypothetical protein
VLTDEVITYTVAEVTRRIRDRETNLTDQTANMRDRQREIEQQLGRLAARRSRIQDTIRL